MISLMNWLTRLGFIEYNVPLLLVTIGQMLNYTESAVLESSMIQIKKTKCHGFLDR